MPLTLLRCESNARLWGACASGFLDELGGHAGPESYPSHLWIAHRAQRDLLLSAASARGIEGWLSPPFSFLSELPGRFGIVRRPIGLLTGRLLVSRLAGRAARAHDFPGSTDGDLPGRGHMVDRALSELLPEGVSPDELARALDTLETDEFTERRNAWLVDTYRAYLAHLEAADQFDPRSIHSLVAGAIHAGGLSGAIGGAKRLHVYGLTSLRGRTRLFQALAEQDGCEVVVYLPSGPDDGEWIALASSVENPGRGPERRPPVIQPVPDAVREAEWVASRVKRLLVETDVAPSSIAVIARSGRDDTRRVHETLERMGVPSTARLRSRLDEVPALRAVLQLFGAGADGWSWRTLRPVLASPYFGRSVDLRALDVLASRSRPSGLDEWVDGARSLADEARSDRGWVLRRAGVSLALIERVTRELEDLAEALGDRFEPAPETAWIELTRGILRGDPLDLAASLNRVVGDRWDIVRLDQRAVLALDSLLREWRDLVADSERPIDSTEWYARLRRLLESNEIALSTPSQLGVQVLEAHEAALTPFDHAFVIHANDGVFPPRPSGGLFTEAERDALASTGLPISTREIGFERERLLWLACTGSERMHVTYRTVDASGIPRLASLFVPAHDRTTELARTRRPLPEREADGERLVTREQVVEVELARFVRLRRGGRPVSFETPDPDAIREATLRAFAEELRSGGLDDLALREATDALAAAAARFDGDAASLDPAVVFGNRRPLSQRPSPWNGEIRDPMLLEHLERTFSATHEWSASQLELYGTRPFDFLLERVLGLQEIEAVEDEASRLTIGSLVHSILESFYRGRLGRPGRAFDADVRAALEEAFDAACGAFEESERQWVGLPHVWAATRSELRERMTAFVEWEFTRPKQGTPLEVEFSFGRRGDRPAADLGGPGRTGDPRPLLLAGRIDRIDRVSDGALRVVDYKSGRGAPSPGAFDDGAALQASIYMAAVEASGLGRATIGSYRTVRAPADRARRSAADIAPSVVLAREIAARVRAGLFEAVQAASTEIRDWQPGRALTRTDARIESGTRFDAVAPMPLPGAEG
ncbi:MAG: PD-(D/E)XK nuclease family protein [Gemmatimonadota bacterium]|nr:PD-(D/E)XK nuclease family protein [Gemmatimonadota bacterium]